MSGLGRSFADLELRNARAMCAGQSRWDNASPPEPTAQDDLATKLDAIIDICEQMLGRAQRAMFGGDLEAARDLLIEAGGDLVENVKVAWERVE